jgi:hypothetical protein
METNFHYRGQGQLTTGYYSEKKIQFTPSHFTNFLSILILPTNLIILYLYLCIALPRGILLTCHFRAKFSAHFSTPSCVSIYPLYLIVVEPIISTLFNINFLFSQWETKGLSYVRVLLTSWLILF